MAARAIGTSTIAFGLVSLPVKLYSTGESARRISFNMVHKECGTRVRQQYVCPTDDVVVSRDDIVKGYEFSKGQFVLFDTEELKVVEAPKSDSIDIVSFVPAERVDRLFFNKAYYLGPDKGGARAYRLLSAALRESERVAIAKHATRGKEYLVLIRPYQEGLLLEQLFYAEEIRAFDEVPLEEGEVNEAELKLAMQLIDQAVADEFDAEAYRDEVRDKTLELIQSKIEGHQITAAPVEESKTQIIDLMAALKASLTEDEASAAEESSGSSKAKRKKAASG
jgi:DNA end-binding protein Ku